MRETEWLAERFEPHRGRLRAVAYRMLGSLADAEDAVQDAWLRLSRAGGDGIDNLGGWLTTVVARECLHRLRARRQRGEDPVEPHLPDLVVVPDTDLDPEQEALLADSVGLALLVVLDRLSPAERLAFVLHDVFDLPFDEIAGVVGRTPAAARQLASRARRRVRGGDRTPDSDLKRQRLVVDAFVAALRTGDFEALLAVLDPDAVFRVDAAAGASGAPIEIRGARNWARGALAYSRFVRLAEPALVNGAVGLVFAPRGRLSRVLTFTIAHGKVVEVEVIAAPERLDQLD